MSRMDRQERPTIGVLAGWQFSRTTTPLSYLNPIFHGNRLAAHDLGCNVLLGCGMGSWINQRSVLHPAWPLVSPDSDFVPIGPWNTDGLIAVNPLYSEERSRYVQELIAAGHPVVFIASGEEGPTILADNRGGTLEAVAHLVDHGHQRIVFIAGTPQDMEGDTGERLRAYHDAVAIHGLATDPRLVAWGRHAYDGGYAAMREILASGVAFTAVLASNDESALGAMQVLKEVGQRIPEDVALMGFDDRTESAVQDPPLSSVRIPLLGMGYRAVVSLYRYLTGETDTIESTRLPTRLMKRKSCGCSQSVLYQVQSQQVKDCEQVAAPSYLAQKMAAPVKVETQALPADRVESLCQALVDAFEISVEQGDSRTFLEMLEDVLRQVKAIDENVNVWQAAISRLATAFPYASEIESPAAARDAAREILDQARIAISMSVHRHYRQHDVDQRWMLNRLGALTARLRGQPGVRSCSNSIGLF